MRSTAMRINPSPVVKMTPLDIARNPVRAGQTRAAKLKGEIGAKSARDTTRRILADTLKGIDLVG